MAYFKVPNDILLKRLRKSTETAVGIRRGSVQRYPYTNLLGQLIY